MDLNPDGGWTSVAAVRALRRIRNQLADEISLASEMGKLMSPTGQAVMRARDALNDALAVAGDPDAVAEAARHYTLDEVRAMDPSVFSGCEHRSATGKPAAQESPSAEYLWRLHAAYMLRRGWIITATNGLQIDGPTQQEAFKPICDVFSRLAALASGASP